MRGFIEDERELGLRVFGMNEERGASVDVGAQHAQAFVGRVPGFDDDVVQFVAQEVFDHALVARFDFEEVGQHADRREAALHHSGLKQAAHGFGGVSVLGDDGFERSFLAESGRIFGAENVEIRLGIEFRPASSVRSGGAVG